jgi:hypothetical protein
MSNKTKNVKTKRCKKGTRRNPKTGECESIIIKSINKNADSLKDSIMNTNPINIVKQPIIAKNVHIDDIYPEILKTVEESKVLKSNPDDIICNKKYTLLNTDEIRKNELSNLTGGQLRVIHSELEQNPELIKRTPGVKTKDELIRLIICLENKQKSLNPQPQPVDEIIAKQQVESFDSNSSSEYSSDSSSYEEILNKPKLVIRQPLPDTNIDQEEKINLDELIKKKIKLKIKKNVQQEPEEEKEEEKEQEKEQEKEEEKEQEKEEEKEQEKEEEKEQEKEEEKNPIYKQEKKDEKSEIIQENIKDEELISPINENEEQLQNKIGPAPTDIESKEYNSFLFNKEIIESENLKNNETTEFLYPELNDPNFNIKIAKHKEFNDTKYEGDIYDIKEKANQLCDAEFELLPHQLFVKNFLSMQTPYNCLLLYHSLGTGKTLSSIGIAEEMRAYMKQLGFNQPIFVIASPNVQQNFRLQLFDERKLKLIAGLWTLNTSIGNAILKEINPTNLIGIPKDRIISEINGIINKYYHFMGYTELANYIKRHTTIPEGTRFSVAEQKLIRIKKIRKYFDNRLIIIDEVHNIRISDDNREDSKTATLLMEVARYSNNMRLVLLSATPMYNNYKEIIWLTNLMNIVDKRSTIQEIDVFDKDGLFLPEKNSKMGNKIEGGRELLQRKLTGYVSYVRGENPYTFPYRIYPDTFSPEYSLNSILNGSVFGDNIVKYPSKQLNQRTIENPLQFVPVYIHKIGEYQAKGYDFIMNHLRNKSFSVTNKFGDIRELPTFENMESFGYTLLMQPLEALNIIFPHPEIDKLLDIQIKEDIPQESLPLEGEEAIPQQADQGLPEEVYQEEYNEEIIKNIVGKRGLYNIMTCKIEKSPVPNIYDFEYKPSVLSNYGRIFHEDNLNKYSSKIAKICESIRNSKGIVLIYSQYIEGGVVPIALALEEMGFTRYSSVPYAKPLFKTPLSLPIDSKTMKTRSDDIESFQQAKYVMITGNKAFSPDNLEDIKYVTNPNNKTGEKVKVIIISKAGSEGLDFKCIRQIHILEPWYNMSRIEQIIGRGVRNFSHCYLDFEERNVEIYLHATLPRNDEEPADLYVYRFAEKKAVLIGNVTRLLKETAIDCILNIGQTNFTIDKLASITQNQNIVLKLSSKKDEEIKYSIGDRPYTQLCDYADNCSFTCSPNAVIEETDIIKNTYNDDFLKMNYTGIVKRIRDLFKEKISFHRNELINSVNILKTYPTSHIDYALSKFVDNKNEYVLDRWGRTGYLINRGEYYAFQPIEITDENISLFEREIPVDHKREYVEINLPKEKEPLIIEDEEGEPISREQPVDLENNQENFNNRYQEIIEKLRICLENVNNWRTNQSDTDKKGKFLTGETDWYINTGHIFDIIIQNHNIDELSIQEFIIHHFLDTLSLQERLSLIKYLYSLNEEIVDDIQKIIKSYFDEKIYKVRGYRIIMLSNDKIAESIEEKLKVYIQDNVENLTIWNIAQPTDRESILKQIIMSLKTNVLNKLNRFIGIMQVFTDNNIVFKTIDLQNKVKKGSRCGGEGKKDIIKKINIISTEFKYNEDNTENENLIVKPGLCVILEMLLRYYNKQKKDGLNWFLGFENNVFIPK